jgi:hypothetical protein
MHPNVIPKHIHALVTCADKLLGLHEPVLTRSEHESHDSKVGLATVAFEVGNEFLGWHSHKLRVEARLREEVDVIR